MNGMEAISNQEICAYQSLYQIRLTGWELSVIGMFDRIALEISSKQ